MTPGTGVSESSRAASSLPRAADVASSSAAPVARLPSGQPGSGMRGHSMPAGPQRWPRGRRDRAARQGRGGTGPPRPRPSFRGSFVRRETGWDGGAFSTAMPVPSPSSRRYMGNSRYHCSLIEVPPIFEITCGGDKSGRALFWRTNHSCPEHMRNCIRGEDVKQFRLPFPVQPPYVERPVGVAKEASFHRAAAPEQVRHARRGRRIRALNSSLLDRRRAISSWLTSGLK